MVQETFKEKMEFEWSIMLVGTYDLNRRKGE